MFTFANAAMFLMVLITIYIHRLVPQPYDIIAVSFCVFLTWIFGAYFDGDREAATHTRRASRTQ